MFNLLSIFVIFVLTISGCQVSSSKAKPKNWRPMIAAVWAVTHTSQATPETPDKPLPAWVCDNCKGKGKLGDGTVAVICPVCGGDGKVDGDEAHAKVEEPQPEEPKIETPKIEIKPTMEVSPPVKPAVQIRQRPRIRIFRGKN